MVELGISDGAAMLLRHVAIGNAISKAALSVKTSSVGSRLATAAYVGAADVAYQRSTQHSIANRRCCLQLTGAYLVFVFSISHLNCIHAFTELTYTVNNKKNTYPLFFNLTFFPYISGTA